MAGDVDPARRPARQHGDDVPELDVSREPAALSGDLISVERHLQPRTRRDELPPNPFPRRADAAGRGRRVGIELAGTKVGQRFHGVGRPAIRPPRNEARDHGIDVALAPASGRLWPSMKTSRNTNFACGILRARGRDSTAGRADGRANLGPTDGRHRCPS